MGFECTVQLIKASDQVVHFIYSCFLTNKSCFIYADNKGIKRRKLWKDLESFKLQISNIAWAVAGDFNVVKCVEKKLGHDEEFNQCLYDI